MSRKEPKDPRSTYRRRARAVLLKLVEQGEREFACEYVKDDGEKCGWTPNPDLPVGRSNNLDANHKNKIISDCDPANLEWLCRPHHYAEDRATAKGESKQEHMDNLYGEGFFL